MLKPSKRHFLRYDAQTYKEKGFIDLAGKVQEMAQKPRFWQITAKAITQDKDGIEQQSKHFKFNTSERVKLGELAQMINDFIHKDDDYLEKCISILVCARVMTEGGV